MGRSCEVADEARAWPTVDFSRFTLIIFDALVVGTGFFLAGVAFFSTGFFFATLGAEAFFFVTIFFFAAVFIAEVFLFEDFLVADFLFEDFLLGDFFAAAFLLLAALFVLTFFVTAFFVATFLVDFFLATFLVLAVFFDAFALVFAFATVSTSPQFRFEVGTRPLRQAANVDRP